MADGIVPASVLDAVEAHLAGQAATEAAMEATTANGPTERRSRATAVVILDVLRASGWVDPHQADQLRHELERLRELLDLVVRDHRAREAVAAQGLTQQWGDWLVPLLRAAHGMEQGTLEAKAALRTAVHQVPAEVLSSAGLRPDAAPTADSKADSKADPGQGD